MESASGIVQVTPHCGDHKPPENVTAHLGLQKLFEDLEGSTFNV